MMTITLYEAQLAHTIRQILHRAGEGVESPSLRDAVQMDGSTSDEQMIRRFIRTGVARVKTMLREHIQQPSGEPEGTVTGTDELGNGYASYTIALELNGDGQSLADLLHWFVVWRALAGLLPSLGLNGLAEKAVAETADAEGLIKDEALSLAMPIKVRRAMALPTDYSPIITIEEP